MAPLVMPTEDNPVSTYDLSVFCEKVIGNSPNPSMTLDLSMCPQSTAIVRSLELLKYRSWRHWRHEFVVFDIRYEGKDYVVHINRGWTGDGWWEYIPWVTWGSVKAAEDCVAIYVPGEAERQREKVSAGCTNSSSMARMSHWDKSCSSNTSPTRARRHILFSG